MRNLLFCILGCFVSCLPIRMVSHGLPDSNDQKRFPLQHFDASGTPTGWAYAPCPAFDSSLLTPHTSAFLIVRNDSIVFEHYASNYHDASLFNVFSISKAVVGCMTGIAIRDGHIRHPDDSIGRYLPLLPPDYKGIRIRDLLDMQSGLRCSSASTAILYYSPHLNRMMTAPRIAHAPGTVGEYSNHATQLLTAIIEHATQQDFASYFVENLWIPIHAEHYGSWSMDSRKHRTVRGFCGLNITARDLAKFGQIYLHNNGDILPEPWIDDTFHAAENPPQKSDSAFPYRNQWRIHSEGNELMANGLLGQYLYINKEKRLIIIRLGSKRDRTDWVKEIKQLAQRF